MGVVIRLMIVVSSIFAWMGCPAEGVGDPCRPERVPDNGFARSEAYIETSSVQCRTRICMVYKLQGNPNQICCESNNEPAGCVRQQDVPNCLSALDVRDRVYCTCRCDGPSDATAGFCECPDGFACTSVLESEQSGAGIRGSYCVKKETVEEDD